MRKIIHDCDCTFGINGCDVDDGLALLYLLGDPEAEVLGVTNSGFVLTAVSFTANHSKAAVCHFRVTKKRRIATTLLSCSEDGARERYSIICCTFSFC